MKSAALPQHASINRTRAWIFIAATTAFLGVLPLLSGKPQIPAWSFGAASADKLDSMQAFKPKRAIRYAPNVVVVTYTGGAEASYRSAVERKFDIAVDKAVPSKYFVRYFIGPKAQAVGETVQSMCALLKSQPGVKFAEPDYEITPDQAFPNDPSFNNQWALHNTGQSGGVVDADIDAPEAWGMLLAGPDVLVAVLDDGVEYTHPDLAANIVVNPGEIAGNGIDDDANGYIDDTGGWDTADNDNDPLPASASASHGTHVAGIVAAVTNNATGVAGTGKRVKILPVRMYKGQSTWLTSLANGLDFARIRGASVLNVSYNTDGFTMFLIEAIQRAEAAGILYVNSSGNNGENMDAGRGQMKQYAQNIMFVAATDRNDRLAGFSNYGQTTDIGAPGVSILSTVTGGGYAYYDGTSMATPVVSGAAATVRAAYPSLTPAQVIAKLKGSADMKGSLLPYFPGGRINLANAIEVDTANPGTPKTLRPLSRTTATIAISFLASGDDGTTGQGAYYDIATSTLPITTANFDQAQRHLLVLGGVNAGTLVNARITELSPGKAFYIAARSRDNTGNKSPVVSTGPVFTLAPILAEGFEGSGWTGDLGKSWDKTSDAHSGGFAWDDSAAGDYQDNENSSLTMDGSATISGPVSIAFFTKHDLETSYDWLFVEYSTNGGINWETLAQITGASGGWRQYSSMIPGTGTRTIKLRFRLQSDESVSRSGVVIDDLFLIQKTSIFSANMEGGAPGWSAQLPWKLSGESVHSPSAAWNDSPGADYANNRNVVVQTTSPINLAGYGDVRLWFWSSWELETNYDFLHIFLGEDGGAPVLAEALTGVSPGWQSVTVPVQGVSTVQPFFRFWSDATVVADGAVIDDVSIVGEQLVKGVASVYLQSLTLSGSTLASAATATGTVTLSGPAGAGGVVVQLTSSDAAALSVPVDVTVPEGSTEATFDLTAGVVNSPKSVTVTASFDGTKKTAVIQVRPPKLVSAVMSPSWFVGGTNQKTGLTVTIEQPAPAGGINVSLLSSEPSLIVVPATLKVLEGQTSRTLFIGAQAVEIDTSVTVTASWQGASKIASVQVKTHKPTKVTTTFSVVAGGSGTVLTGAVTLNGPAPVGGLTVDLSSSNTDAIGVPASVQVLEGKVGASFPITHKQVAANLQATITATAHGVSVLSGTITVTPHLPSSVSVAPGTVIGGSEEEVVGTININAPAPVGGYEVVLSSSLPLVAKPQISVVIPEGAMSATFSITHFAVTENKDVRIRGTARGKTVSVSLIVTP
ncbi:MAG: S8 family serine peptidase [Fimbriimonas sp.]